MDCRTSYRKGKVLAKYDVLDEALLKHKIDIVYNAVLSEFAGKTSWWMPHVQIKAHNNKLPSQIGALFDLSIPKTPVKFTAKVVDYIENELFRVEYVSGVFSGEGAWEFKEQNGETKVKFRWQVSPSSLLMKIMAVFMNVPKNHSKTMKAGFDNLQRHLDNA